MSYDYQSNLKESITFQTVSTGSVDERGLYNSSWVDAETTKCRIEYTTTGEEGSDKNSFIEELQVFIPASVSVEANHRAVIGSDYYDIEAISIRKNRHSDPVIKVLELRKAK
jgi:hypothetical protein